MYVMSFAIVINTFLFFSNLRVFCVFIGGTNGLNGEF